MDDLSKSARLLLDRDGLLTHADAAATGKREALRSLHRAGALERIGSGVYGIPQPHGVSSPQRDAERYRRLVVAAARRMPERVFTSYSAAALLGLPIVGRWPEDLFILSGRQTGSRRPGVREIGHRLAIPETVVNGVRVTTPDHTLIQLARHASLPAALVAADAALRRRPWVEEDEPLLQLEQLHAEHTRLRPYHGSRRAAAVLHRATPLADGPLETLSRFVIDELGFAQPELQARFWLPGLRRYAWVDFYWPEVNIAAEADGHGKYLDGGGPQSAAQRVIEEKQREDELRLRVDTLGRWDWQDVWSVRPLERTLERIGVPRVRPARRVIIGLN